MIGRNALSKWSRLIRQRDAGLISRIESIYGPGEAKLNGFLDTLRELTDAFSAIFGGDRDVSFVRAPARLNTLGMHVDHRGGFVNPIALDRETVFCYTPRGDDTICVHNLDPRYGDRNFRISEELPDHAISSVKEWLAWTQKETDQRIRAGTNNDWINKLKVIPVYLGAVHPGKKLRGFDAVVTSNIPQRVGLSSSSTVVVSVLELLCDINGISISDGEFVDYCGEGEWYVGTRGGSGDHAAIKFGRFGMITHMRTIPKLEIVSYLPFPKGYRLIIFDSGIEADKTGDAGQKFNEKTASYEIGEIFIREYMMKNHGDIFNAGVSARQFLPPGAKRFFLADVVERLDWPQIYKMLGALPERIDRKGLLDALPEHAQLLRDQFATHREPGSGYQIRAVALYGLAECERSRIVEKVLNESRIDTFARMMNASHDGDRVSFTTSERSKEKVSVSPDSRLHLVPGGYDCSIPEIDEMVDLALDAGADGAQISGAGLGGSIMALVKTERAERVIEKLVSGYYLPRGVKANFLEASAVQGACIL